LGNLTSTYEVKRDGYTLYLNINHSFTGDSTVQNLTFGFGVIWVVTEGTLPVPMPTPIPEDVTLRNGESEIFYGKTASGQTKKSDKFEQNWEYVQINILSDIGYFRIQFSDEQNWESEENVYFRNGSVGGDLFALLYLNKVEVETETIQIKTA